MKITFKDSLKGEKGEVLFVSVDSKNKDEIVKENGVKTLYLKCDEKMTLRKFYLLVRKMVSMVKNTKARSFAFNFSDFKFSSVKISDVELGEIIGTQLDFANYEFTLYKTPPKEGFNSIKEVFILGADKPARNATHSVAGGEIQKAILKGNIIADEVNKTRSLSNTSGGDMTPSVLAQKAKEAVKGLSVTVKVLGEKEMAKLKMGAILAMGRGSDEESKFIIME
ncbi:MAG: hypothetical protein Q7K54_03900, partial [Candidatus Parcubacteria bacterium]|nr:hypothetical protein [Candidatus Parcubacteria bacterium]